MGKNLNISPSIVFDFDGTLFDTEKLKNKLKIAAFSLGLNEDETKKAYQMAYSDEKGGACFEAKKYSRAILKMASEKFGRKTKKEFDFEKNFVDYVLPGAESILKKCEKSGANIFLLSLGSPGWQKKKVVGSGLGKYFSPEKIFYTSDPRIGKVAAIKKIFGKNFFGRGVCAINDKPDESEEILRAFPDISVLARRDKNDSRYAEKDFAVLREKYPDRFYWHEKLSFISKKIDFFLKNYGQQKTA